MCSLLSLHLVLLGGGVRLTNTGLVSEGPPAPSMWGGVFNIHFGRQHPQIHCKDARSVKSPEDKDRFYYTCRASPRSRSSIPSSFPGPPARCQKLFKAPGHILVLLVKSAK